VECGDQGVGLKYSDFQICIENSCSVRLNDWHAVYVII
jgi:hypothetical protein